MTLFAEHFQLALSDYTVKPCNFQLDKQIFIHHYFRFGFDTGASILHLTEMRTLQFDTHSLRCFEERRGQTSELRQDLKSASCLIMKLTDF